MVSLLPLNELSGFFDDELLPVFLDVRNQSDQRYGHGYDQSLRSASNACCRLQHSESSHVSRACDDRCVDLLIAGVSAGHDLESADTGL